MSGTAEGAERRAGLSKPLAILSKVCITPANKADIMFIQFYNQTSYLTVLAVVDFDLRVSGLLDSLFFALLLFDEVLFI